MSDLISKRFIQDALIEKISNLNAEGATQTARELIRLKKFVDGLTPPASADAVHGEWKIDEYGIYHCPICHAINNTVYKSYCPNCGAKMEGREP